MSHSTIIDELWKSSVRYNDLVIPGRLAESFFSQYCQPLAILSEDPEHPLYWPGSSTLIKHEGRFLLICTRHQLKSAKRENACIMIPLKGATKCFTSGGAVWWRDEFNEGDHNELAIFDFTDPCMDSPHLKPLFLDFKVQHVALTVDQIAGFVTYGYLSQKMDYDPDFNRAHFGKQAILSRYLGGGCDNAVHTLKPLHDLNFHPDGISGGPTFCFVHDHDGFSVHLAGITVRAGKSAVRIIKSEVVKMMLDGKA